MSPCAGRAGTIELTDRSKIVEIPEIHTVQGVQTCERLSTALVRHVAQAQIVEDVEIGEGRPRMATGSFTDGHRVVHGWPQGRVSDGQSVVYGWPQGRVRMATGRCTDGHRAVYGWPEVVYGWPEAVYGCPGFSL